MTPTLPLRASVIGGLLLALGAAGAVAAPEKPECIAPAKPGGGFDITCKLAQSGLQEGKLIGTPMRVTYMPGGIGAVAYNAIVAQRPADPNAIVAFSSGSLLNLAIGKFGQYTVSDVRWVASVGTDYGVIAVRADSPLKTLKDLVAALQKDPASVAFGAGGTVGSQDWMKTALVARLAGVNHQGMRYVAFEGGGEAFTALLGGHVQVYSGDVGELAPQIEAGKVHVLAVLADERLPGKLGALPTAKEQGFELSWPIVRGFYVGPKVSDADYQWWVQTFDKLTATPEFEKLRTQRELQPFTKSGAALDAYVKEAVARYAALAREFDLVK